MALSAGVKTVDVHAAMAKRVVDLYRRMCR
jgi:hypothetical protein